MTDHASSPGAEPTLTPFGAAGAPDEEATGGRRYEWPPVPLIPTLHNSESKLAAPDHAIWRSDPRLARIRLKVKWRSREYVMERADLYGLDARIEDIAMSWGGLLPDEKYLLELVHLNDEAGYGIRRVWTSKQWGALDAPADQYPVREWKLQAGQSGDLPTDVAEHLRAHNALAGKFVDERGEVIEPRGDARGDDFAHDFDDPNDEGARSQGFNGGGQGFGPGHPGAAPFGGFAGGMPGHPGAAGYGAQGFAPGHPGAAPFPGASAGFNGFPGAAAPFPAAMPGQPGVPPFPAAPVLDLFGGLPRANGHVLYQGGWLTDAQYLAMLPRASGRIFVAGQWLPEPPPAPPPFGPTAPFAPPAMVAPAPDPANSMVEMMRIQQQADRDRLAAERDAVKVRADQLETQRREDDRKREEAEARRREADDRKRDEEWRRRDEEVKQRREDERVAREEAIRLENQRREDAKAARDELIRLDTLRREEERRAEDKREERRQQERREAEDRQEKFLAAITGVEEKRAKPPSAEMVKMGELMESLKKAVEAAKAGDHGKDAGKLSTLRESVKALRADAEALGIKLPGLGEGGGADSDSDPDQVKWEKTIDRLVPIAERVTGMAEMYFGKELREADTNASKYAAEAKKAEAELAKVNAELAKHRLETAQHEAAAAHARLREQELHAQHSQPFPQPQGGFNLPVWSQPAAFAPVPQPTYPQPGAFAPQQQSIAFAPQPAPAFAPQPPQGAFAPPPQQPPQRPAALADDDEMVGADDLLR